MFTGAFWKDAAERVVSTAAEVALPAFAGASLWGIDWRTAAGLTGAAALAALCKALVAGTRGDNESAALYVGRHRGES